MNNEIISVVGGDLRNAYVAGLFAEAGFTVFASGLENSDYIPDGVFMTDIKSATRFSDIVVLPLPASRDGVNVNAPFADSAISLSSLAPLIFDKEIYAGLKNRICDKSFENIPVKDYYDNEQLLVKNALLTAEGAVGIAITKYCDSLSGAECLITGFGRIGKILLKFLTDLHCKVFVAARKKSDLIWIENMGGIPTSFDSIPAISSHLGVIFNTVPAPVIGEDIIKNLRKSAVIIDLASAPGGVDFESAHKHSINAELVPGIPGIYSPLAAARVIMNTIISMHREASE